MKKTLTLSAAAAALLWLAGCGDSTEIILTDSYSPVDVKVIDGYVTDANVTDNDGQQAVSVTGGVYQFGHAPAYPIHFTVGYGRVIDTGMTMDINMSAGQGRVISPISTVIAKGNADLTSNLASVLQLPNDSALFSDYIANNNTDLAKLSQLCYAMLKDTNATQPFLQSLTTDFNATADANITALIDNTLKHNVYYYSTKVFLKALRDYNGTVADMETGLRGPKADVGYYYDVNNTTLRTLIASYINETNATQKAIYARRITYAATAPVTDMSSLFDGGSAFNLDITGWDTSGVTDMSYMFSNTSAFDQPIGDWDTAKATDFSHMFDNASAFNQPLGKWNTSNVTDMSYMFSKAAFNQPIGDWNTSNVTDMSYMFQFASYFNQDVENWNTLNATNMAGMFSTAIAFNQPIGKWNTSNVTDMSGMFNNAYAFNQPLGDWNTSNVTDMTGMFAAAKVFNRPIGNWDTSNVTDMSYLFYNAYAFDQNISDWNVTAVGSNHADFDTGAGFEGNTSLQPQWIP